MTSANRNSRRNQFETHFDRTAVDAWNRLTSDAPVGSIRATVRAGRDEMRAMLLSWLPSDLRGARVLDAGCGTGALAVEVARRDSQVVAIDISPTLVDLAREQAPSDLGLSRIEYAVGDMRDFALGRFDNVIAMHSLINCEGSDIARTVAALARRTNRAVAFTIAPRKAALTIMHAVGRLFPRGDRAPAIATILRAAL